MATPIEAPIGLKFETLTRLLHKKGLFMWEFGGGMTIVPEMTGEGYTTNSLFGVYRKTGPDEAFFLLLRFNQMSALGLDPKLWAERISGKFPTEARYLKGDRELPKPVNMEKILAPTEPEARPTDPHS